MNKKFIGLVFTTVLFGASFLKTASAGEKSPKELSENLVPAANSVVRFHTGQGDIDVQLFPNNAPLTVANFLGYVARGDYNNSFIHRLATNFVLQGGGYKFDGMNVNTIPAQPPVMNEFRAARWQWRK